MARAECRIERVSNLIGCDVQGRRLVAIDVHHHLRTGQLEIAGDAAQQRELIQSCFHRLRNGLQLRKIDPLDRILVLAAALPTADLQVLDRLNVDLSIRNLRKLDLQAPDHVRGGCLAHRHRLQPDEHTARSDRPRPASDRCVDNIDGGIAADHICNLTECGAHCRK